MKQGISLIVLVITIIVMIILAGAIILTLSNNGIINNASNAVQEMDKATAKEIANLAWAETYAENASKVNGDKLNGEKLLNALQHGVEQALEANNLKPEEYGINITLSGVDIVKGWIQDGLKVKRGKDEIEIGTKIAYDEMQGKDSVEGLINVEWQVLGAGDNGELLILSDKTVADIQLSSTSNLTDAQNGYIYGVTTLNEECEPYGYGAGVVGKARSITVEDINKVTGYNPEVAKWWFGAKETEYGNKATITWQEGSIPYYTTTNGLNGKFTYEHNGKFMYYKDGKIITSTNEGASAEAPKAITTLTNSRYIYYPTTLTSNESDEKVGISKDRNAYKMLFNTGDYWTASPYELFARTGSMWGFNVVQNGIVSCHDFFSSWGMMLAAPYGVRAVVPLSQSIPMTSLLVSE